MWHLHGWFLPFLPAFDNCIKVGFVQEESVESSFGPSQARQTDARELPGVHQLSNGGPADSEISGSSFEVQKANFRFPHVEDNSFHARPS
jgi:hypothetical protein